MKNENNKLSIYDSVKSNELAEISTDLIECGIDQLIDNEILKDIPILGAGYKLVNFVNNVSETFYIQKILKFLFQIQNIPLEKRIKFIEKLEQIKNLRKLEKKF